MLNNLIKLAADANLYSMIYDLDEILAYVLAISFVIMYGKKLGVSVVKSVISTILVYMCSSYTVSLYLHITSFFIGTSSWGNIVVMFIYIPLYCILFSKIMKCSWKVMWDYTMCAPLIIHIVCRWGCVFMGCCHGFPCEWGIYNLRTDCIVFPIQIIESVVAFTILCYVVYRSKKREYKADGYNVPIILISYGIARFFLEYFHDNSKHIFGWSKMTFQCIITIIVGIMAWRKLRKDEKMAKY